uniref:Iron hydrogenase large subunit C-terminal domain-containing protein n=1 Tax=Leptocylindrus danicus TaxID=163516 RepID=A0A7S2P8S7_9STRA|mmetsp:Transcript_25037/g.37458  ORF Transcript_25037/g.37458 Transcript_25037/m.37458 type:complete len:128 (+) Transcript_25037:2-385(+)
MACPSGCLNGGGQIRHDTSPSNLPIIRDEASNKGDGSFLMSNQEKQRESPAGIRGRMRQNYNILSQRQVICPYDSDIARHIYSPSGLFKTPFDEKAKKLMHTRFHAVPKLELSSGAVEGLDPEDTHW